ncbi:uncharacterized protein LOC123529221 [Mercenaria mercenaria]|uniref:uncharacterized protein LOC123529221 n=1 Tax=Mercenaria mercenaria TaxID=6596 RepID=UPI00234E3CB9|nr:uncharacterized protein LOC123529221 [Mercenaria mercenaria]
MAVMGNFVLTLLLNVLIQGVQTSTRDIFMDSPTACGKTFSAGDREEFRVKPRGTVGVSNPPTSCAVYFESSQASSNYKFEIVVEAASFRDCGLQLRLFDGRSTGGSYLRVLGCGSTTSTAQFYSKDRAISLMLTRTQNQYFFGSDFQLKIQLYRDTEGSDEYIGIYKFPAGAIIGIVLGVIVIIAAAILLGWCYKNGRLPGLSPYEYPTTTVTKASTENLSRSEAQLDGVGSKNGAFVAWHNTEGKNVESRSNFNLEDSQIWESLTSINTNNTKKDNLKPVGRDNWNGRGANRGGLSQNDKNRRDNNTKSFQRLDPNQLSNSPNTRIRGRKDGQPDYDKNQNYGNDKDTYNTINDLEREPVDRAGDRLLKGKGTFGADNEKDKKRTSSGVFVNPDKEGYMYDYEHVQKLSGDSENVSKPKTQDFASELQAAIKRASLKRQKSENQTDSDGQGLSGKETQNESSEFSSSAALNKQTDGEMTGPDAQSSPKPKKKKRKSSKERKSPKPHRKHKKKDSNENDESPDSKSSNVNADGEEEPPEIFAPIFGDEEVPETAHQYQPGYQGNYPPAAPFDPRYPMGPYQAGMPGVYPPGMPYQQAGQAQWYVEANPNGQHKMAFAMTTHSQSDDSLRDNLAPNYTSTPYYPTQGPRQGPNDMSMVPAGTILDDPRLPDPGTSLVRYDDDPLSGVKTSQVVWTDARKDPTDPPPDSSSQITRKTITRITTKATEDELPDAPNPSLQDMSWRTAQGIQESRGHEPPFMSPTKSAYQANAIQYATETPERSNAGYYMGSHRSAPHQPTYLPAPASVIHEAPKMNNAIRDRIVLHSEAEA